MEREALRLEYLAAMGIEAWVPRHAAGAGAIETASAVPDNAASEDFQAPLTTPPSPPAALEIPFAAPAQPSEPVQTAATDAIDHLGWDELEFRVAKCKACELHATRTQTVFGVGDRTASWLIIGEAPGEQEDLKGEPFVGRAGQLLNEMLRAIGLSRDTVYIANVLKCRPPRNRDPSPAEAGSCEPFLHRQVALIAPDIIVAVGRIAAQNLLKTATPIGKLRGTVHRYQGIPLVVTYHPAYLLRSPGEKRRAWDDLQLAVNTFREQQQQKGNVVSSCSNGSIG
ncbi:uracil-DNA glycosylase [Methylotetracoccus oryzae]|uniref:uracil-DNA glycosylase n=1 Tax=Methylotetracoccus oryzae TaxID=1919059 RepID=UPI001F3ED3EC|nr:uracil-DNA glycosylase [Methylotetracoccus oryzae]